jgi:uncharacterized protein YjdB
MFARCRLQGLLLLCLGSALVGCTTPSGLDSVQVSPGTQALAVGQTAQFTATGTFGNGNHLKTQNITSLVTWTSSVPAVATIDPSTGIATAVSAGTTTITASATAFNGPTSSSATVTVTGSSGTSAGGSVSSLAIIPSSQAVASPTQTTQFLAIGTTSSGATVNLTNQVAWTSSSPQIATINATTGLATGVGKGNATITAIYNASGGTVITGTATFTVLGGASQQFTAVTILPSSQTLSTLNETAQFIALATSGTTGLQQDVTSAAQLKWTSSLPSAGSISATGLAKNLASGNSTITAVLTNSDGSVVSNSATLTTTLTAAPQDLLSLTIIPSSITLGNLQATGQFLAIGTFATPPYVRDITNSAQTQWITSAPNVFPVTTNNSAGVTSGSQNAGVASAFGNGTGVIVAEAMGSDGTIQTATAAFSCPLVLPVAAVPPTATTPGTPAVPGSCFTGSQTSALLSTLTVYNEGLNTNTSMNWQVTAPSVSNPPTPNVLHCGPGYTGSGGSVCTATYPVGATVVLTATGGAFGGWSVSCQPVTDATGSILYSGPPIQNGPNYCKVTLTTDDTVGAIFN